MTPLDWPTSLSPFLGRRLRGIWRSCKAETGVTELWLAFAERAGEPGHIYLSAIPSRILPGWISGGGPTVPTLLVTVADTVPEEPGIA